MKSEHASIGTVLRRSAALSLAVCLICGAALVGRLTLEQRDISARLIRLHVVASSDDPADQARKLAVRDAVLPVIARLTAACPDARQAGFRLREGIPEIRSAAEAALADTREPVAVTLLPETFPRRDYPTFSLPAGNYTALRVTIGAGAGHNWWCVAFPALCLPAGVEEFEDTAEVAGFSEPEVELMTRRGGAVRFKFRVLEWLSDFFG